MTMTSENHPAYDATFETNFSSLTILKGGFLTEAATKIIMGTFPPPKSKLQTQGENYFYYPNNRNQFWNIIDAANCIENLEMKKLKFTNKSLESFPVNIQRKADFSFKQRWAFLDFFTHIERRVEDSSKDTDLIDKGNVIQNKLLFKYLDLNKKVNQISCTYKTSYQSLLKHLQLNKQEIKKLKNNEVDWIYKNRKILINLLPPPTRSFISLSEKVKQYNSFLYN